MIKICLLMLFILSLTTGSHAARLYVYGAGPAGGTSDVSAANALYNACYNATFSSRNNSNGLGMRVLPNGEYALAIDLGLETRPVGSGATFSCGLIQAGTGYVLSSIPASITISQSCLAGSPARLVNLTTIDSFTVDGLIVPAEYPANPQCVDRCIAQHAGGTSDGVIAYTDIGTSIEVGTGIYVVVTQGITLSGQTCNFNGADVQGAPTPEPLPPLDQLTNLNDFRGASGSSGGSGSPPLDANDKANLAAIAENTASTSSNITAMSSVILGKLSSNETAAGGRQVESMAALNGIRDALNSIDSKTGNGSGNSNVSSDGYQATGGIGDLGGIEAIAVPDGGLKSPGEALVTDFKTTLNLSPWRDAGTCPTWTLNVDYFSRSYVFDNHCTLFNDNRAVLESVMVVVWTLAALATVLKA